MTASDSHRANGSDSIEDGDIEKDLAHDDPVAAAVNDFANGGPVQDDFEQHGQQKEAGAAVDGVQLGKQVTQLSTKPSVHSLRAIPNGGTQAWLQVLGSFFLFFNSW